jgi:sporulation protein YlmC with PRC-barrel domain
MIPCNEIRQRTVIDAAGLAIGEVEEVLVDASSWRVEALRVRLRREVTDQVGATKGFFRRATIDVSTTAIQSIGDAVLLSVGAEHLRDDPQPEETRASPRH